MSRKLLIMEDYGCSYGKKTILCDINLSLNEAGIYQLLGPCGAGKTTLLRSLTGLNKLSSIFKESGKIFYNGEKLGSRELPAILEQKPAQMLGSVFATIIKNCPEKSTLSIQQQKELVIRLLKQFELNFLVNSLHETLTKLTLLERRLVSILSLVITSPSLLLLDEPTHNLEDADAKILLSLVKKIALSRAVFMIQHNQKFYKYAGGVIFLLAGGTIQEETDCEQFYQQPQSEAGKEFIKTGTCSAPSPDTDPKYLDEAFINKYQPVRKVIKEKVKIIPFGTQGFKWALKDKLAVTPRPGLLQNLDDDLKALKKVNIDYLICLETKTIDEKLATDNGIKVEHFPFEDMTAPSLDKAKAIVYKIKELLSKNFVIAIHCKAGLGRTGTILACYFIALGDTPKQAIEKTRLLDVRMIQSEQQEQFVLSVDNKILTTI